MLRRLNDEAELRELIHRYAFGLDTRDWDLWRGIFTDEVLIDTSDYEPEPPPRRLPVDKYVSYVSRLFAGFEATQHFIGTHHFVIGAEAATITAHFRAEHWATTPHGGDRYTMFGTYVDECVRSREGWRIASVKLGLVREEGNRDVMRQAELAARSRDRGTR